MEFYFDLEQGSYEWHEMRYAKIGGTSAKGLFVKSDNLKLQILSELTEDYQLEDIYVSDAMLRGKELEPEARNELSEITGVQFLECGWIQSDYKFIGISPDGISPDKKIQCELKCPEAKKHISTLLSKEIPLDNIHQCIHAFTVNKDLEEFYFMSYRPESIKSSFIKKLTRESEINIGTEARPKLVTISQAVSEAIQNYELVEKQITEDLLKLNF
jgi:hypothetical protein